MSCRSAMSPQALLSRYNDNDNDNNNDNDNDDNDNNTNSNNTNSNTNIVVILSFDEKNKKTIHINQQNGNNK